MNPSMKCIIYIVILFSFSSCEGDDIDVVDYEKIVTIIPDIQYYTNDEGRFHYLNSIVQFLKEERENICFSIQTGDVTNNNLDSQWDNAYQHFFSRIPKKIPMVFCLGNHDYGNNGMSDIRESNISEYMQPSYDIKMEGSKWDNYIEKVWLDGKEYGVMVLEFAPRNEVLDWVDSMLKSNPEIPFILLTHAFLNNQGKLFNYRDSNCDNEYSQKSYSMGGDYLNDSKEIFEKIIFNNTNVKMVICGHCLYKDFIATEYVQNTIEENVPCIMVNYQHDIEGGRGNIGILAIKDKTIYLYSYSTIEKRFLRYYTSFTIN